MGPRSAQGTSRSSQGRQPCLVCAVCLVAQSCATPWTVARQLLRPWHSPGWNTGVSSRSLLQGIFPTQESKPGLPLCGQILYQLSHQGSPRILERVAYPFSRASFPPRNGTRVYRIAGGFLSCPCAGPAKSQLAQRFASPQPRALEGLRQRAVPRGERARGRESPGREGPPAPQPGGAS